MSPDFGKDRKLKMKKKRKVPVKIKLKRNYSSEHWDTLSLPSSNSTHHQQGANHNTSFSSKLGLLSNQNKDDDRSNRFKDSSSLLVNSSHMSTQQTSSDNNLNTSGQNFIGASGSYAPPVQNQPNFESNIGSPQSFSWDDLPPSQNNKLQTVQERVQTNVPQMPAKLRLSSYHQSMYYNAQQAVPSNNQTNQAEMQPNGKQGNTGMYSGNQGNSMTTSYGMQNYDSIAENSYPERGLEQLLEKSNDGFSNGNNVGQSASNDKISEKSINEAVQSSEYTSDVARSNASEEMKVTNTDTMSLTTINKDDLISEIDSLKRDHEESQTIERTKLKKKKKFFISADVDSSINSPKDSPKFRILKKKYRHSFVKSVTEKVRYATLMDLEPRIATFPHIFKECCTELTIVRHYAPLTIWMVHFPITMVLYTFSIGPCFTK